MKTILLYTALTFSLIGFSQVESNSELFKNLKAKDSLLFNEGLNKCNLELMAGLLSEDLEFYHDKGGITKNKESFINQVKNSPCKTGTLQNKRILVQESLKVFPLYNKGELYGAIQLGEHMFADTTAKFTHLWLLQNGHWKISRVLSYDH